MKASREGLDGMSVPDGMDRAIERFNEGFRPWEISFPIADSQTAGVIHKKGWAIHYAFGSDSKGPYLDYYASHRMTDDSHVRLRGDGSAEALSAMQSMRLSSTDPTEDARLEREYLEHNREVLELLRDKGFLELAGVAPPNKQDEG